MNKTGIWSFVLLAPVLFAQNDSQANVNLQFRFTNPGARAQAMGGAFIGLADDTTALFANPAGLAQMRSSTLVLEGNHGRRDNNIPFYGGRIQQTGIQDFRFDLESRDFKSDQTSVPFLGYVNTKAKIHWGLFLAEQGNFERDFETGGVGIPTFGTRYVSRNDLEYFPNSSNSLDLQLRSIGTSAAIRVGEKVSLGMTLTFNQMEYDLLSSLVFPNIETLFPEIRFSARQLAELRPLYNQELNRVTTMGKDEAFGANVGVLLTPTDRFGFGLAYKYQPKFDYQYNAVGRNDDFSWDDPLTGSAKFSVPDSYGLGISFKPSDVTVFSVEATRVLHSELSDTFTSFFDTSNDPIGNTQRAPDVTEYHAGMEYIITSTTFPIALRLGYWFEPYHALQNEVLDTQLIYRYRNANNTFVQGVRATAFLHQFAKDLNHLTAGFGLTMGQVVLDMSADIDDENASYSLSSIYRFK